MVCRPADLDLLNLFLSAIETALRLASNNSPATAQHVCVNLFECFGKLIWVLLYVMWTRKWLAHYKEESEAERYMDRTIAFMLAFGAPLTVVLVGLKYSRYNIVCSTIAVPDCIEWRRVGTLLELAFFVTIAVVAGCVVWRAHRRDKQERPEEYRIGVVDLSKIGFAKWRRQRHQGRGEKKQDQVAEQKTKADYDDEIV